MENHHIAIANRQRMTVSQVTDVDAFDETALWANLEEGGLEISGEKLHIEKLDLEEGILIITGQIHALEYTDKKMKHTKPLLERLRRK